MATQGFLLRRCGVVDFLLALGWTGRGGGSGSRPLLTPERPDVWASPAALIGPPVGPEVWASPGALIGAPVGAACDWTDLGSCFSIGFWCCSFV